MWMVMRLEKSVDVEVVGTGQHRDMELSWADGMVGIVPVFKYRKQAEKYAEGKHPVVEVKIIPVKDDHVRVRRGH